MANAAKGAIAGVAAGVVITLAATGPYTHATTAGAHEAMQLVRGDTSVWHASVKADGVLGVIAGVGFVCLKTGTSFGFQRFYRNHSSEQITADTIEVTCVDSLATDTTTPPPIDTARTASVEMYDAFYSDSTGAVYGVWTGHMEEHSDVCVFVAARDHWGRFRTGQSFTLSTSDPAIVRVLEPGETPQNLRMPNALLLPSTCPDTTIDPAQMRWSTVPGRRVLNTIRSSFQGH